MHLSPRSQRSNIREDLSVGIVIATEQLEGGILANSNRSLAIDDTASRSSRQVASVRRIRMVWQLPENLDLLMHYFK